MASSTFPCCIRLRAWEKSVEVAGRWERCGTGTSVPDCWARQMPFKHTQQASQPRSNRTFKQCFTEVIQIKITTKGIALEFSSAKIKEGVPKNSLCLTALDPKLEVNPQCELQSPHGGSSFYIRDLTVSAALAVNAAIGAVISAEGIHGVVEHVKRVHAELSLNTLSDGDILRNRRIRIEPAWSAERIVANVAEFPNAGIRKRTTQSWQRSEVLYDWITVSRVQKRPYPQMEGPRPLIRPAHAYILLRAAFIKAGRPRQTAAPVGAVGHLPSADQVVHDFAGIAKELFAFAEWQFVNRVENPYLVAHEIVRSIRNRMTDGVIGTVVGVGARVCEVRNKLETAVETFVHLGLKRVVVAAGIVAVKVA